MTRAICQLVAGSLISLFLAVSGHAATFVVNSNADANDGTCDAANCTLREAVIAAEAAADVDEILFNLPAGNETITLLTVLQFVDEPVTIDGDNAAGSGVNVTIDGNNSLRMFEIRTVATIRNINLVNGSGIGVSGPAAVATVSNVIFDGHSGSNGAAIVVFSGTLNVANSTFTNNQASTAGGAIFNQGTATITNSTFDGNGAPRGAAIGVQDGTLLVQSSTFIDNQATVVGGAIFTQQSVTIVNSTFSGNTATAGSALFGVTAGISVQIINSTIANNVADSGAIRITEASNLTIKNVILSNNLTTGGSPLNCSISTPVVFDVQGINLISDNTCTAAVDTGLANLNVVTTAEINLGGLAANGGPTQTFALNPGSVAINLANDCTDTAGVAVATDQRGTARPQGGICDVGSFEAAGTFRTLTITANGPGNGRVTDSSQLLIDCTVTAGVTGGDCSQSLLDNSVLALTATADVGSAFGAWSACDSAAVNVCTQTVSGGNETATVAFALPPGFSKAFAPTVIESGAISNLTLTINNTMNTVAAGNLSFTDNLPAGVIVATPSNATTTCTGGTLTATAGSGTISYTGGTVGAGATCTVSANVTSVSSGMQVNTSGDLTSSLGNSGAASATLTVLPAADLGASLSDSPDPVVAGTNISYTATATNNGPDPAANVSMTVQLDAGTSFVMVTPSAGGVCNASNPVMCSWAAATGVGAANARSALIVASVPAGTANATVLNATNMVSTPTTDPGPAANTAMASTLVQASADLAISKDDGVTSAVPGQSVTYQIVASNPVGPSNAVGATVTDTFPTECTSVTWTCVGAGGGTCTAASSGNIADTIALPVGGSATYTAICNIDPAATGTLDNTASISAAAGGIDPNAANDSATDSDALDASADLSMALTDTPDPVVAGEDLSYLATVTNDGPSDAQDVSISLPLPTGTSFVSATADAGGICNTPAVGANGTVACDWAGATAVSAMRSVTVIALVDAATTGTLNAVATAAAASTDPNAANDSASVTTAVLVESDLAISKDDGVTSAVPGQSVTYSIVASNAGPSDAVGAMVSDNFPTFCTSVSWTCVAAGGGSCAASGSGNIADTIDLPVGGTATYTAVCDIDTAATGTLDNTATIAVAAGSTDPSSANNSATDTDTLVPTANVSISKTDNAITAQVGTAGSYLITASNAGPSDAPAGTVTDTFPANVTPGAWTCIGTGGGVCPASGSGNIAASVDLPSGASVAFTVAAVYDTQIGIVSNTATTATSATVTDPDPANNSATDTTEIVSPATLSATKIGIANMTVAGGSLNYVIEVSNAGPQNQLDNPGPEMVDVLPFGYVYLSATTSSGTLNFDAPSRTLEWSGPVAVGQVISISINGSIDPAVAGMPISNQAELRFDADGNGSNEASALSDDPSQPGNADPTVIGIAAVVQVPALDRLGLLLMALLLAGLGAGWVRPRG